jgi:glycopeptide antibiotics resistance protein
VFEGRLWRQISASRCGLFRDMIFDIVDVLRNTSGGHYLTFKYSTLRKSFFCGFSVAIYCHPLVLSFTLERNNSS